MSKSIINKKLVVVLSVLLIFAIAMTGCSSKDDAKGGSDATSTVTVSISCETLKDVDAELMNKVSDNGIILKETEIGIEPGQTALDVIKASGADLVETGGMISEINGLKGGDAGEMSGWLFKHNGEFPPVGAADLELADGDKIEFVYTTNGGEDLGLSF